MSTEKLFDDCLELQKKINELFYNEEFPDSDGRRHIFGVLKTSIAWIGVFCNIMKIQEQKRVEPEIFAELFGTKMNHGNLWLAFSVLHRKAIVAEFNFQIENFFKILLSELNPGVSPPMGYYQIVNTLLQQIEIDDADNIQRDFTTLSLIRNSFHNDGVHIPLKSIFDEWTQTIESTTFEFKKGEIVDFNYFQLLIILKKMIEYLETIVQSDKVKELESVPKTFIPI